MNTLVYITFLSPNKKVTKEIGIGEALEPCCRTSNTPSPMYPTRGALGMPHGVLTT